MPPSLGDSLFTIYPSQQESPVLSSPSDSSWPSNDVELQQIHRGRSHSISAGNIQKAGKSGQSQVILGIAEVSTESNHFLPLENDETSHMGRKPITRSQSPSIAAGSGRAGDSAYHANDHTPNGSMSSTMEMRRKHAGLETDQQKLHLLDPTFSLDHEPPPPTPTQAASVSFMNLPARDRRNFLVLVLLYFLQGIPMGLAMGSVPFLLKPFLSYGQVGIFTLASYPYSLKLLWSPIVDAVWSPVLGRRKSWILPIQMCSGIGMIYMGSRADAMMTQAGAADGSGIWPYTWWWFFLVFLCATQDIAVDGWALTLLSPPSLSYASTAQTVGLTGGHFMSYTVFLALNGKDFANRWFRTTPQEGGLMSLGGYLTFWGWAYILVTLGLAMLKREEKTKDHDGILDVYQSMWGVLKLKNIQSIIILHLIAKIGFQANDGVTNLKLIDLGFSQGDLALTVLIDFPFEIGLGYYAGRWSERKPLHIWCYAFVGRLVAALLAQGTVMLFPANGVNTGYLLTVIGSHILSTFTNTVMFVSISAFHAKISDPLIGGTYMTLLATVSNLGGTFPRIFVLKLVDLFTQATCQPSPDPSTLKLADGATLITSAFSCALEADKHRCILGGGTCRVVRDGYYITNMMCVLVGALTFWLYIRPTAMRLQALRIGAWRLGEGGERR